MGRKPMRIWGRADLQKRPSPAKNTSTRRVAFVIAIVGGLALASPLIFRGEKDENPFVPTPVPRLMETPTEEEAAPRLDAAPKKTVASPTSSSSGKLYAIVVASIPMKDGGEAAHEEADKMVKRLRVIGFREAKWERIGLPEKGEFLRVIAMTARYPSAKTARADIKSMIKRGEIERGFPLKLEE